MNACLFSELIIFRWLSFFYRLFSALLMIPALFSSFILFIFVSFQEISAQPASIPNLPLPSKNDSLMLVREHVSSFFVSEKKLFFLAKNSQLLIKRDLSELTDDKNPFARTHQTLISDLPVDQDWLLLYHKPGFLMLNQKNLEFRFYSSSGQLISKRTLWYDKILPPADRGGEAPASEIREFRKKYVRAFKKTTEGPRFTGITPVPDSWIKDQDPIYFLLSRIRDFPIVLMKCKKNDPTQCFIFRGCFSGSFPQAKVNPYGIAAHHATRELVIGIPEHHQLSILKYQSCFDIQESRKISIPERIKEISDVFIDEQNTLYISTKIKDDYFNASLFRWSEKDWTR